MLVATGAKVYHFDVALPLELQKDVLLGGAGGGAGEGQGVIHTHTQLPWQLTGLRSQ